MVNAIEEELSPIGIKPLWLHNEIREKDICGAIDRYIAVKKEIPLEWFEELINLNKGKYRCCYIGDNRGEKIFVYEGDNGSAKKTRLGSKIGEVKKFISRKNNDCKCIVKDKFIVILSGDKKEFMYVSFDDEEKYKINKLVCIVREYFGKHYLCIFSKDKQRWLHTVNVGFGKYNEILSMLSNIGECFIDGNCLTVVRHDFINLQESEAVFIELNTDDLITINKLIVAEGK